MTHLGAICILVVVSVLVQNASGKRGCAAFGHACYGGHGKRSSSLPENLLLGSSGSGGFSSGQLDRIPPLPYAKLALINRSKPYDVGAPELRLTANELATDNGEPLAYPAPSRSERQDKFERGVRYAVNAILRQLLEESQAGPLQRQPSSSDLNFQPSEAGQLQQEQQLMDNEQK
ncbi:uncharacterized protein CCHa2 [Ochlerotatus camptorhynchus]|uniref:uncharacterized protein CCHa2 n=1 Tax=Ochlerotatus camptorhynchus TaxID=644619 RepID=UPI0031D81E09